MRTGKATVTQIFLDLERALRLQCPPALIPAPGQYVLAQATSDSHTPLAVPLFPAAHHPDGFTAAGPLPPAWSPGLHLRLRGPLGRGLVLPQHARRVGLLGLDTSPARLLPVLKPALEHGAAVALACAALPAGLPPDIEVSGLSAAPEIAAWADCLLVDVPRALLPELARLLGNAPLPAGSQVLVHTAMPCGGMGECGACAVGLQRGWAFACKDGPVFALDALVPRRI